MQTTLQQNIIKVNHNRLQAVSDHIIIEQPIQLQITDVGNYTIMCTPEKLHELAVGFLLTQNIIDDLTTITSVEIENTDIRITLSHPEQSSLRGDYFVFSSSGMGRTSAHTNCQHNKPQPTPTYTTTQINKLLESLHEKQQLFQQTGGAHAAAIFDSNQAIITVAEDIGRHNALDKAIGHCLLHNIDLKNCGVVLSSRISYEMVYKASRAKLTTIIAVSAPTSLAISTAKECGISLIGFARPNRFNCY